jgi:acylglycerol lipase
MHRTHLMNYTANQITATFRNRDLQKISYKRWKTNGRPKAIVLIVHGLNSHSGYYRNFAAQLCESEFEVYAGDLRGRGESEGERYYIHDFEDIIADIDQLYAIVNAEHPMLPVFLFGHSAGGVFASLYAERYQYKLKGFISESFALQLPAPGFALAIMKVLGSIIPHKQLVKLKNADFSRDKDFVELMNADPLLADEKQPARTMQQLILAGQLLKSKIPDMKLPILILHGTADRATNFAGSKYFMKHAGTADKQLELYEGYYHDLLNDHLGALVVKDIINWLNKHH